jgi:hypothetical protein
MWLVLALGVSACGSDPTEREVVVPSPSQPEKAKSAQAQPMTCMPKPSACGFPDPTNTGVAPGTPLTPASGIVTLDKAGQVYENKELTGSIIVKAPNVTVRNVRLVVTDPYYGVSVKNGDSWENDQANLVLDHVEINLNGKPNIKGIAFNGFTLRNVYFHNGADCAHFGQNVVIESSLCALGPDANGDGNPDGGGFCDGPDHYDGFQSDGGHNITLRHNTIRNPCGQTAAILMSTNTSPIDSVVIDNNLMSGGGYTVYCGTSSGGVATHETYTNNVISREFFPKGGYWGPTTECEKVDVSHGNVWDGNYVPPAGSGGGGGTGPQGSTPAGPAQRLVRPRARRVTRAALARELGRRYTRHAKTLRLRCGRRSASVMRCAVKWSGRDRGGARHRYTGSVKVKRVSVGAWRYSLRVKDRSGRCKCSKLIKRTGTIRR